MMDNVKPYPESVEWHQQLIEEAINRCVNNQLQKPQDRGR